MLSRFLLTFAEEAGGILLKGFPLVLLSVVFELKLKRVVVLVAQLINCPLLPSKPYETQETNVIVNIGRVEQQLWNLRSVSERRRFHAKWRPYA